MSLLKQLFNEEADGGTTGADSIANYRGALFAGGPVDPKSGLKNYHKMIRRSGSVRADKLLSLSKYTNKKWKNVFENTQTKKTFDQSDVVSKLEAAQKRADADEDVITFGLEDDDGNIIKVYVRAEQAEDFENVLGAMLSGADQDDDDENTPKEIAEVLYELKDKFDIVDVDWGVIEGDEEQEQVLDDQDKKQNDDQTSDSETTDQINQTDDQKIQSTDDTNINTKSTLQSVIDVLIADAESRKAEAQAKQKEAEAETAKYTAQAASNKIKQQEQILDMEADEKAKKTSQKEAKILAKLAKYKHKIEGGDNIKLEHEEIWDNSPFDAKHIIDSGKHNHYMKNRPTISKDELAKLILKHLAHNS